MKLIFLSSYLSHHEIVYKLISWHAFKLNTASWGFLSGIRDNLKLIIHWKKSRKYKFHSNCVRLYFSDKIKNLAGLGCCKPISATVKAKLQIRATAYCFIFTYIKFLKSSSYWLLGRWVNRVTVPQSDGPMFSLIDWE